MVVLTVNDSTTVEYEPLTPKQTLTVAYLRRNPKRTSAVNLPSPRTILAGSLWAVKLFFAVASSLESACRMVWKGFLWQRAGAVGACASKIPFFVVTNACYRASTYNSTDYAVW